EPKECTEHSGSILQRCEEARHQKRNHDQWSDPTPTCPPVVRFLNSRTKQPYWDDALAAIVRLPLRRAQCREEWNLQTDNPCLRTSCLAIRANPVRRRGGGNLRTHISSSRPSESN